MKPTAVTLGCLALVFLLGTSHAEAALVAYYSLDDGSGSTIGDSLGSFDLPLYDVTTAGWSDGKIGSSAYTFNGTDWAASVGSPLNGASSFSFSWWMNTLEGDKDAGIISTDDNGSHRLMIWKRSAAVYANGYVSGLLGTNLLNDGEWHHYVLVKENDGTDDQWQLYRDGVAVDDATVAAVDFTQGNGPLRFARHANSSVGARWPGTLDDVALWDEALSAETIALTHGLGQFAGVAANDSAIDSVYTAFQAGAGNSAVAGGKTWVYASAAELANPTGSIGTTAGNASTNAYIVLDAAGNGMQVVNNQMLSYFGAGTDIAYTTVDTNGGGPRTNVDRAYTMVLEPGVYEATSFSFAYGQDGTVIPFLAAWDEDHVYEIIAVGDAVSVTGSGVLTVDFSEDGYFELDATTRLVAGFTNPSGSDNPVYFQNGTLTTTDHTGGTMSLVVGGTTSTFSHPDLGRTYAFQITVVPEPSSLTLILAAVLGLFALPRRRRP